MMNVLKSRCDAFQDSGLPGKERIVVLIINLQNNINMISHHRRHPQKLLSDILELFVL